MGIIRSWLKTRKANKELGDTTKGGQQGVFKLNRFGAPKPYFHKEGSDAWVMGRVHNSDLKSSTGMDRFLSTDEECHGWINGATRSNKGVSQIIYNVLTHPGSQMVVDPKAEAYLVAAKALAAKGKKVFLFDPLKKAARRLGVQEAPFETDFNPMLGIMDELGLDDPELPTRVSGLTHTLIEVGKKADGDMDFWNLATKKAVAALLAYGLVWRDPEAQRAYDEAVEQDNLTNQHLWDIIKQQNILIAADFPSLPREQQVQLLEEMASLKGRIEERAKEIGVEPVYPTVIDMIDKGAKTGLRLAALDGPEGFASLLEMIDSSFAWINSPSIKDHLRGFDMKFRMPMFKEEDDIVLFVVLPDTSFESHGAYLRMAFTSMVDACTNNDWAEGVNPNGYKINAICDEVALWGHMPALERLFKLGAGAGLRAIIITQNKPMMDKLYGKDETETFIDNSWQLLLAGGGNVGGEYFSKKAGKTRARNEKTGEPDPNAPIVPVLSLDELWNTVHRKRGTAIFFENGKSPLLVRMVKYFEEDESCLKKFIDYTPHIDHASKSDQFLDPSVPRELMGHIKGAKEGEGKRHIQIGGGARKQIASHPHH